MAGGRHRLGPLVLAACLLPAALCDSAASATPDVCTDPTDDLALLQRPAPPGAALLSSDETTLESVIAVSRHSIKSLIYNYTGLGLSDKTIDQSYGAAGGDATPHGLLFAKKLGAWYREQYGQALGLDAGAACGQIGGTVQIYADEDARDIESGNQWLEGFAPGCGLKSVANDVAHIVLQEGKILPPGCEYASEAEVSGLLGGDVDMWTKQTFGSIMDDLDEIFGCCAPSLCKGAASTDGRCRLRDIPNVWLGGYWDTWTGGLQYAGWMAATLQTQYVNNNTVLGGVSAEKIDQLYEVSEGNWYTYRNKINANRFGGTLATYLVATLLSAAMGKSVLPENMRLPGQQEAKFQWFMGHDVNVGLLSHIFELDLKTPSYPWHTASIFLGALIFELHSVPAPGCPIKNKNKKLFSVRIFQEAPTTSQLRHLDATKPPRSAVSLPACSDPLNCPVGEFVRLAADRIVERCVNKSLLDPLLHKLR